MGAEVSSGVAARPDSNALAMMRYDANKKSVLVAYILWFFLGMFGAHRFYLGAVGTAVTILLLSLASFALMFVLVGAFLLIIPAIWVLVDAFLIPGLARRQNNDLINQLRT